MNNPEHEPDKIIAVDAVVIPSPTVKDVAISLSEKLDGSPITLGSSDYVPHITLAMGYVTDLKEVERIIKQITSNTAPFEVIVDTVSTSQKPFEGHYFSHLGVKNDDTINILHRSLVQKLPFMTDASVSTANFVHDKDEKIVPAVFQYIASFTSSHSGGNYWPHITLGAGKGDLSMQLPLIFTADSIYLFQLGNFCTCRKQLGSWKLKG